MQRDPDTQLADCKRTVARDISQLYSECRSHYVTQNDTIDQSESSIPRSV